MDHKMNMDHGGMKMDHHDHSKMKMDMSHDHSNMMNHAIHMGNLKKKFWWSLVFSLPVFLGTSFMGLTKPILTFPGMNYIVTIFASIVFFYGGGTFFPHAKMELEMKKPGMMMLIVLAISASYIYSIYGFIANTFFHGHYMDFYSELVSLILVMLLGHWIENNAVAKAGDAVKKISELLPNEAILVDGDQQKTIPLATVKVGQVLLVRAGDKVPTDGIVVHGKTSVDESMVTGESRPIVKDIDSKVIGGSVNGDGTIEIKVTGTGKSGYLSQVIELINNAQKDQSGVESLANKVSGWLFYASLIGGILAFIIWLFIGGINEAFERMVTVLVIACPHALGLAIPLVVARTTSGAARNGLLIRKRESIELASKIKIVTLDKTGTLTKGVFRVQNVVAITDLSENKLLQLIASVERGSNHPLAQSILKEAKMRNLTFLPLSNSETLPGVGIKGTIADQDYLLVSPNYLTEHQIDFPKSKINAFQEKGSTVSFLLNGNDVLGYIVQGDELKPEAASFIADLKARGITPVMLTGDNKNTALNIASQIGITEENVFAELKPNNKEEIIQKYQKNGQKVMMIGDGINDAPSLTRADIGVAIGAGTDIAIDSADVVLISSNLDDVLSFFDLAKASMKKMVQNLWWGAGYNIIAIPLAAGILAPWHIILTPAMGAILMTLSTIVVAINALSLKVKRYH